MTNLVKLAIEGQFEQIPTLSMEEYNELEAGVERSQAEIAAELDDAEKTMSVVSALEDLAFVADTIDTPNPREAALIQIAADAAMIGTGVDGSAIVPAMEDGGDGKSIATRIKDIIARILAALKEMFLNLYKKIKDYLDGTERLAQQLKKKISELREKAKDLHGHSSKSMEVATLYMGQTGYKSDQVPLKNAKEILSAIAEYNKFVTIYTKGSSVYLTEMEKNVDQFYNACTTDDRSAIQDIIRRMTNTNNLAWLSPYVDSKSFNGDEYARYLHGYKFLGCLQVNAVMPAKAGATVDAEPQQLSDAFVKVFKETSIYVFRERSSSEKITMMSLASLEIDNLLDHVDETVTDISKSSSRGTLSSELRYHTDKFDVLVGKISKIAKSFENKQGDVKDFIPYINTIKQVSSELSKSPIKAYSRVIANNIDIAKRSLAIVSASIDAAA